MSPNEYKTLLNIKALNILETLNCFSYLTEELHHSRVFTVWSEHHSKVVLYALTPLFQHSLSTACFATACFAYCFVPCRKQRALFLQPLMRVKLFLLNVCFIFRSFDQTAWNMLMLKFHKHYPLIFSFPLYLVYQSNNFNKYRLRWKEAK